MLNVTIKRNSLEDIYLYLHQFIRSENLIKNDLPYVPNCQALV